MARIVPLSLVPNGTRVRQHFDKPGPWGDAWITTGDRFMTGPKRDIAMRAMVNERTGHVANWYEDTQVTLHGLSDMDWTAALARFAARKM